MMTVPPENLAALQETDIFLASFPRSGNTWMRYLLSDVILQLNRFQTDTELPFAIGEIIPDIYVDDVQHCPDPRLRSFPRWIKTHQYYEPEQQPQRIVYLFRDPADALCSYYHYKLREGDRLEWATEGLYSFCLEILPLYQQHLSSHLLARQERPDQVLFISYERLSQYPCQTLQRVLQFAGLQVEPDLCWRAVENHLFSKHQSHEQQHPTHGFVLPFFRKGQVGGGRAELDAATIALLEEASADLYRQAQQWEQKDLPATAAAVSSPIARAAELPDSLSAAALAALCEQPWNPSGAPPDLPGATDDSQRAVLRHYAELPPEVPLKLVIPDLVLSRPGLEGFAALLPPVQRAALLHPSPDSGQHPLQTPLPAVLVCNATVQQQYEEHLRQTGDRKHLLPTADPFVYGAELLRTQPPSQRRGTLVLPPESAADSTLGSHSEALAEVLLKLEPAGHPVTLCLHWRDVRLGRQMPLIQRGLRVVSAGHPHDPAYLFRLYHLLARHQWVAGGTLAPPAIAPLVYALWLGCGYLDLDQGQPLDTAALQDWAAQCLGVDRLQSPPDLRQTLQIATAAYDQAAGMVRAGAAERQELWQQLRRSQAYCLAQYQEQRRLHQHIDAQSRLIEEQAHHIAAQSQQLQTQHQHILAQAEQLQAQHQQLQEQAHHIAAQSQQLQTQHQHILAQAEQLQTQHQQLQEQAGGAAAAIATTPEEAQEVRSLLQKLEQSQAAEARLQQRLHPLQEHLQSVESSKFWQLRQFWLSWKRRLPWREKR